MAQLHDTPMIISGDLLLQAKFRALRHLPPAMSLALPTGQLTQALFAALRALPDDVDIFYWAQHEQQHTVALLALALCSDTIDQIQRSMARLTMTPRRQAAMNPQQELQDRYEQLLGRLPFLPAISAAPQFSQLAAISASMALQTHWEELREMADLPHESMPRRALADPCPLALIADLLRLPARTDIVQWLAEEHSLLITRLVLARLAREIVPQHHQLLASPLIRSPWQAPGTAARFDQRLDLTLTQIDWRTDCFVLHCQATYQIPTPVIAATDVRDYHQWEGVDQVMDDAGNHYVIAAVEHAASITQAANTDRHQETLAIVCAPAYAGQHMLVVTSPQVALAHYRVSAAYRQPIPQLMPILGRLDWHLTISLEAR